MECHGRHRRRRRRCLRSIHPWSGDDSECMSKIFRRTSLFRDGIFPVLLAVPVNGRKMSVMLCLLSIRVSSAFFVERNLPPPEAYAHTLTHIHSTHIFAIVGIMVLWLCLNPKGVYRKFLGVFQLLVFMSRG